MERSALHRKLKALGIGDTKSEDERISLDRVAMAAGMLLIPPAAHPS